MSCSRCGPHQFCPACTALLARAEGTPAAAVTEAQLLTRVREVARRLGWWRCYHTYSSKRSEPGFPDLVLARTPTDEMSGRLIFAELKREGESPTIPQQQWLETLKHAVEGIEVYLWRPSDLDNIVEILLRK